MDLAEIRRITIIALFADDWLCERLVLKGGNALRLIYELTPRTSLDLGFSIETDFDDFEEAKKRVYQAIKSRFASVGFTVFNESFERKPGTSSPDQQQWWGGYELKFKLIDEAKYNGMGG